MHTLRIVCSQEWSDVSVGCSWSKTGRSGGIAGCRPHRALYGDTSLPKVNESAANRASCSSRVDTR
eukprot:826940-Pyramimonas_sp.AAC.1